MLGDKALAYSSWHSSSSQPGLVCLEMKSELSLLRIVIFFLAQLNNFKLVLQKLQNPLELMTVCKTSSFIGTKVPIKKAHVIIVLDIWPFSPCLSTFQDELRLSVHFDSQDKKFK